MRKLKLYMIGMAFMGALILSSCGQTYRGAYQGYYSKTMFKYEYYPVDGGYGLDIIDPWVSTDYQLNENPEYLFDSVPMGNEELVLPSYYNGLPILEISNAKGLQYDDELKTVVLPEKLEYIKTSRYEKEYREWVGTSAFQSCNNIESIVFPSTLKKIENNAFSNCNKLDNVFIPGSVEKIGDSAFAYCRNLKDIYLADGVKEIGDYAFNTGKIKNLRIPETLESVGVSAFSVTRSLCNTYDNLLYMGNGENPYLLCVGRENLEATTINIKDGCKYIAPRAFENISVETLTIPSSVKRIFELAFGGSKVKNVTFSSGIEYLGDYSFKETQITSLELPDSLISLGKSAFSDCKQLESISLPKSIREISQDAFSGCKSLNTLTIPSNIIRIEDGAFSGCSSLESIDFKEGLKYIGSGAFMDCTSLNEVTLPDSLIKMLGYAFYDCSSLKTMTISDTILEIPSYFCGGCTILNSVQLPKDLRYIDGCAFSNCKELKSVTFPNSLKEIGACAFMNCPLENITIPKSVSLVKDHAFKSSVLDTITFEEGASGIDAYSFGVGSLDSEYLGDENNPNYMLNKYQYGISSDCKVIGKNAITDFTSLIEIPEGVIRLDDYAVNFNNETPYIVYLHLPNSLESIGNIPFIEGYRLTEFENGLYLGNYENPYLVFCKMKDKTAEKINISSSCKFILNSAFYDSGLKEVTIPEGVKEIGDYAFRQCRALEKVSIPNNVKRIGAYAFSGCTNLKDITLSNSITCIEEYTFKDCTSLKKIDIPNGVVEIGEEAFLGSAITNLELPSSVKYIATFNLQNFSFSKRLNNCYVGTFDMVSNSVITFDGTMEELKNMYVYRCVYGDDGMIIQCLDGDIKMTW
ncbi:leucine rich repeat (LRR) protein [Anaeroplasma bactoclasticum]|uniref:Leucine rich repeat (LRR) protein n=1 Tax=Anaeroplasma bactoclasticum TaxID=2088 RepID=A0A397RVC5_9MOLU|nr:leucine-rich repeat domain-containing protein [Anaeroplasma bactoclasticum]RIA78143.1 leucine rich repeat (LRR) protein [Anaeroplasma bactoclasticum]